VVDYKKSIYNGRPLNNIFTYLLLKEGGQEEAANRYLAEMKSVNEGSNEIQWVILVAEQDGPVAKAQETGRDHYKNIIVKVISLAGKR